MSHITGVASGLLGVYLRWLLYSHEQPFNKQGEMEMKKSQDPGQKEEESYNNANLADIIVIKERQLQKRQQLKMPSEHLRQRRKAAMLENSAQELLVGERQGSGSIHWGVILLGSSFLVLSVILIKGFKGTLKNIIVKTMAHAKKTTHVI